MNPDDPNSWRRTLSPTQQRTGLLLELHRLVQSQETLRRWNASGSSSQASRNSHSPSTQFITAPVLGRRIADPSDLRTSNRDLTALALSQFVGPNQHIGKKDHDQEQEEQPSSTNSMNWARSGDDRFPSVSTTLLNTITRNGIGLPHRLPELLQGQNSPGRTVAERIQPSWGTIASQSSISKNWSSASSKDTSEMGNRLHVASLSGRKRRIDTHSLPSYTIQNHHEHQNSPFSKKKKRKNKIPSTSPSSYSAALNGTLNGCSFPLPRLSHVSPSQLSKKDEGKSLEAKDQPPSTQPLRQQLQSPSTTRDSDSNSSDGKDPHPSISGQSQLKMLDSRFEEINRSDDDCID